MSNWIAVSPDNGWTRWEVNLREFAQPVAVTLCVRRDTGLEFTRTLKPGSANWKKAVGLAARCVRELEAYKAPR
jgi:hypothetical protein